MESDILLPRLSPSPICVPTIKSPISNSGTNYDTNITNRCWNRCQVSINTWGHQLQRHKHKCSAPISVEVPAMDWIRRVRLYSIIKLFFTVWGPSFQTFDMTELQVPTIEIMPWIMFKNVKIQPHYEKKSLAATVIRHIISHNEALL